MRTFIAALVAATVLSLPIVTEATESKGNSGNSNNSAHSSSVALSGAAAASISGGGSGGGGGSVQYREERQAPGVAAPSLSTSGESCMGSSSIGGSGAGFGLAFGTTWKDDECTRRMNSQQLRLLGHNDAALAILCTNVGVADAMAAVGKRCPASPARADAMDAATVAASPVAAQASGYCARNPNDHYCRP